MHHKEHQAEVQKVLKEASAQAWQGIKNVAAVNTSPTIHGTIQVVGHSPATFPNNSNSLFSMFETDSTSSLKEMVSLMPTGTELQHGGDESPQTGQGKHSNWPST